MPALTLLAAAIATAVPAPPQAVVELPQDHGPQDAIVVERTFPVGGDSGWHTHPGYEIGHVVSGETELHTAEGTVRYRTGETFVIPRGVVHNGANAGGVPTVLVITYVVDRGAPPRSEAADPGGH